MDARPHRAPCPEHGSTSWGLKGAEERVRMKAARQGLWFFQPFSHTHRASWAGAEAGTGGAAWWRPTLPGLGATAVESSLTHTNSAQPAVRYVPGSREMPWSSGTRLRFTRGCAGSLEGLPVYRSGLQVQRKVLPATLQPCRQQQAHPQVTPWAGSGWVMQELASPWQGSGTKKASGSTSPPAEPQWEAQSCCCLWGGARRYRQGGPGLHLRAEA